MAVVGSFALLGLVLIGNCSSPVCERLMFDLGLALTALVSAGAQALILGGVWLLWRAITPPGSRDGA